MNNNKLMTQTYNNMPNVPSFDFEYLFFKLMPGFILIVNLRHVQFLLMNNVFN